MALIVPGEFIESTPGIGQTDAENAARLSESRRGGCARAGDTAPQFKHRGVQIFGMLELPVGDCPDIRAMLETVSSPQRLPDAMQASWFACASSESSCELSTASELYVTSSTPVIVAHTEGSGDTCHVSCNRIERTLGLMCGP